MNMELVEVIEIRRTRKPGPLLAFADLRVGSLLVRDFRVMQENGSKPYVKAPFTTYKDKTGQLRFRQIIDLPNEVRGQVDNAILNAFFQREMEKRNGHPTP
jgi:hypothetical protein